MRFAIDSALAYASLTAAVVPSARADCYILAAASLTATEAPYAHAAYHLDCTLVHSMKDTVL